MVAFPINIPEVHWLAASIDVIEKTVYIMDSALPDGPNPRQSFAKLILQESLMTADICNM
jgi:hypothetical protein